MTTLTLWGRRDPFAAFDRQFDGIVRAAFGQPTAGADRAGFRPAAEVTRDGDDAIVALELPGVDVERDVTVEIVDHELVVRGERRDEREDARDGYGLREVRYGSFRRSFGLPEHVTPADISASYDAGILRIRVVGIEAPRPEPTRIAVTTGSATKVVESGETA